MAVQLLRDAPAQPDYGLDHVVDVDLAAALLVVELEDPAQSLARVVRLHGEREGDEQVAEGHGVGRVRVEHGQDAVHHVRDVPRVALREGLRCNEQDVEVRDFANFGDPEKVN